MSFYNNISNKILKEFNSNKLNLHEPVFSKIEINSLKKCINSGIVSTAGNGFFLKKLENQIRKFTKSRYVISTINGVSAIHASLIALGIKKNEEVIVPSLTFVATIHPLLYIGAIPHFAEIENENFGICPKKLDLYLRKISYKKGKNYFNKKTQRRIKAIIPVHVFGNPCKIIEIKILAKKYNLKLIEDSTEALGSFYKKKHVGTFGEIGIFSFNGNKIITSGGGGAIITNNKKLYTKILFLVSNSKIKHKWEYVHNQIGYNYRMPNINASLLSAQFEKINNILKIKKNIFKIYKKIFSKFKEVSLISTTKDYVSNNWLNTIIIKDKKIKKEKLIRFFHKKKIFVRPAWKPLHTLKHLNKFPKMNLSITNNSYKNIISLPSGPGILK